MGAINAIFSPPVSLTCWKLIYQNNMMPCYASLLVLALGLTDLPIILFTFALLFLAFYTLY